MWKNEGYYFFVRQGSLFFRRYSHASCSEGSPKVLLKVALQRTTIGLQRLACAAPARSLRSSTPQLSRSSAGLALLRSQACVSAPARYHRAPVACFRRYSALPAFFNASTLAPQRATLVRQRPAFVLQRQASKAEPSSQSQSPRRASARAEGVLRACRGRCIQNKKAVRAELHK